MEAVSDESSFSRNKREQDEGRYASGNHILWLAAIAVLIGLNFASWSFCMWVFGQPEHPMNYRILTRLDKIDPIHGFTPVSAPRGEFYSAKDLYSAVYPLSDTELRAYNGIRKRSYLLNFKERDDVTFLSGEFRVERVRELGEGDIFSSGMVVRGPSISFPDLAIELVLPSDAPPESLALGPGDFFTVEESLFCAAVLHVERADEAELVVTAVPLVTRLAPENPGEPWRPRPFEFARDARIALSTPPTIRLEREHWPVIDDLEDIEPKPVELKESEEAAEDEADAADVAKAEA